MGNICCRREIYAPNATDTDQSRLHPESVHQQHLSKHPHQAAMSSAYHSAGDDCAINELLEGRMDLDVLLPDGRKVRLTVERRTPMMDLLVQAASATKISPGGHVIQVFGDGDKGPVQYKPSTPIGSLDTKTICIVPKKEAGDPLARRTGKNANRPFEPTFRVQVHLPRNQLTVLRVSPRIKISELKSMVCKEKGMEFSRYQLVRPSGPTQPLAGDMTLSEYGSTEITLLSNSSIESHVCNSSHIIPYAKDREEPKRKNGILRLLTEDARNKVNESSKYNSTSHVNGILGHKSDEGLVHRYKPKKRRPAPPPPPPTLPEAPSHSRQSSSDSSGYHEATSSFLHEEHSGEEKASSDSSGVSSLDGGGKGPTLQHSPPPLQNLKKKKAPPPPPPAVHKEKPVHRIAPKCPVAKIHLTQQHPNSPLKESNGPLDNCSIQRETKDPLKDCSIQLESRDPVKACSIQLESRDPVKDCSIQLESRDPVKDCSIQLESCDPLKDCSNQPETNSARRNSSATENVNVSSVEDDTVKPDEVGVSTKTGHALRDRAVSTDSIALKDFAAEKGDVSSVEEKTAVRADASPPTEKTHNLEVQRIPNDSAPSKDSTAEKVDVAFRDNGVARKDIRTEACLTELKRVLEDYITSTDAKDPIVVSQKTAEINNPPSIQVATREKIPSVAKNFTISTYTSSTLKDPIIRDIESVLKVNPVQKDYFARENGNSIAVDQILKKDHVIPRDQVLKLDAVKKLDLPRSRESEGQFLTTVAAKALPAAKVSTDPVQQKDLVSRETSLAVATENISSADESRLSPEKKVRKSLSLNNKDVSTRVALVALNARIERDVSQQEIASSIRAAFHSVDSSSAQQQQQPSLLRIQQRPHGDLQQFPVTTRPTVRVGSFAEHHTEDSNTLTGAERVGNFTRLHGEDPNPVRDRSPSGTGSSSGGTEQPAREALLIDEDPPPRPSSAGGSTPSSSCKSLKRSSSLLSLAPSSRKVVPPSSSIRGHPLQRSLSDLTSDDKEDFESEQQRLQKEYVKLQRQFLLWQQQLMSNHAMLREECLVSAQYAARTLRQSHSLPEGEDGFDEASTPVPPLVSRSLSYEPTRCSTLPRSAINIPSFDFGSVQQLGNGTSTLRSSKTKSYFKPPQVRASTKNRQRLPPEIKKEGDVDITDDAKMLTTILPSFESLRLIAEHRDEETHFRLTDCATKKIPVVHLSATFPKLRSNSDRASTDRDLKQVVNGDSGHCKQQQQQQSRVDCPPKVTEQSQSAPPPPPPPMPVVSKCPVIENCGVVKSSGQRNGVSKRDRTPEEDPRERLMLEIRKCGGRTALRKISLAS